jgi:hypothetical protein
VVSAPLSDVVERLALSDEETLAIFELDALAAIAGEVGHRPEVEILDVLTAEAAERLGLDGLARWLRAGPPGAQPLDLLLSGNFGAFEDALGARLAELP